MIKIFGISNCDNCRKARLWLTDNSLRHEFHDLRVDGVNIQMLERWTSQIDWQQLLNTRSQTWRDVPAELRQDMSHTRALALMLKHPTLIKRPVFESSKFLAVGFSERRTAELLQRLK